MAECIWLRRVDEVLEHGKHAAIYAVTPPRGSNSTDVEVVFSRKLFSLSRMMQAKLRPVQW